MERIRSFAGLLAGMLLSYNPAVAGPLPHLQQNGRATQLMVDGAPYLALGGELHNSSPSSPAYMAPIWEKLARNNVRTVIGAASWELVEPEEGRFDFAAVDDQIKQARAKGIRLVLIWFGAYKNAQSTYAPSWVRRNETRFPRAAFDPTVKVRGIGAYLSRGPILSVFSEALLQADARAFAALMDHIRKVDRDQTVIMMQVENEVGLIGNSRDWSAPATAAWSQPVPPALIAYLKGHRETLRPTVSQAWSRNGYRDSGTWAEVFGTDAIANEIFMAWGFGSYVEGVTKAGASRHPLPMYTNAWLGPQPGSPEPGDYPSGGPVARMMDVWKAAAPSLALLAPDIYVDDFDGTLADFKQPGNPIFIPEAKTNIGNMFVALGSYDAIAFSPFGIEDVAEGSELYRAYALLNEMTGTIASAQADGRIAGFRIGGGKQQQIKLGGYDITFSGPMSTLGAFGAGTGSEEKGKTEGYGLVIHSADNQFLIVGRGIFASFAAAGAKVEIDTAQEGTFSKERWVPGRTMNGDERFYLFPKDDLRIIRLTLLKQ